MLPPKKYPKAIRLVDAPPPIAPLDLWPAIQNPKEHVAAQAGRYLAMYEGVMNHCMQTGDVALGRAMLLDLLRLTEVGRQKAELSLGPQGEIDLSHLKEEDLLKLVAKDQSPLAAPAKAGERQPPNSTSSQPTKRERE